MFTAQNVHYNNDLTHNLIFYELLKQQNFKIENIEKDELNIFKITDSQEQIFKTLLSEINIYSFLSSINSVFLISLAASVKKQVDLNESKINYKNIKIMKMWYRCLAHLNTQDIIHLFRNSKSEMIIKSLKELLFCKVCILAESWSKISCVLMSWSKYQDEMLHIDTDDKNYTLEDSDEEILFFSETKYFLLITDNTTQKHWVYFLKEKSDLFDVLIFFFNYLKNLDIQLSVILRSDWAEKILSIRVQKFLKNNETKWKLSAFHIQYQNEIFKHDIQTIYRQNRTVII